MEIYNLEDEMRACETFHGFQLPEGYWPILRVDGRGFSKFTEMNFDKPFDIQFRDLMIDTAEKLLVELGGIYAYVESDEISILLNRDTDLFNRRAEKIATVAAGFASAAFSYTSGYMAHFDGRVVSLATPGDVASYFKWRRLDSQRCATNGLCYWELRRLGNTPRQATKRLEKLGHDSKIALLEELGIKFKDIPSWQLSGCQIVWEEYVKQGFNPVKNETVFASRNRTKVEEELPEFVAYSKFLGELTSRALIAEK